MNKFSSENLLLLHLAKVIVLIDLQVNSTNEGKVNEGYRSLVFNKESRFGEVVMVIVCNWPSEFNEILKSLPVTQTVHLTTIFFMLYYYCKTYMSLKFCYKKFLIFFYFTIHTTSTYFYT